MVPLVGLIIFLGVYPQPVLARIAPSVNALLNHLDSETGKHQPVPGASPSSPPASADAAPGSAVRYSGTGIAFALGGIGTRPCSRFPRRRLFDGQGRVQGDSHGCRIFRAQGDGDLGVGVGIAGGVTGVRCNESRCDER